MKGKNVCVINRSEVVGRPLAAMLANDGADVYSIDISSTYLMKRGKMIEVCIITSSVSCYLMYDVACLRLQHVTAALRNEKPSRRESTLVFFLGMPSQHKQYACCSALSMLLNVYEGCMWLSRLLVLSVFPSGIGASGGPRQESSHHHHRRADQGL